MEQEGMTDEQMLELLKEAQTRVQLQNPASGSSLLSNEDQTFRFPRLSTGDLSQSHTITAQHGGTVLRPKKDFEETTSGQMRRVEDPVLVRQRKAESKKASAGEKWYNLPKTDLTPALKRDLQILKMRNVLDPHRHYKKEGGKMKAPEYSQVGTIIEGPTEYYSGRVMNRDRKRTFVEEVLAGEQETGRFKRKYGDLQTKTTSGKKAFYKALKAKRSASYKKR